MMNRMNIALNNLFHSNFQSSITRNISLPINKIIIRSFVPLSSLNLSIWIQLFLPSNLRGVINYLHHSKINDKNKTKDAFDYLRENIYHANGFICNSLKEFDEKYIEEFHQLSENFTPIYFIGPLIFHSQQSKENKV